jgi:hypothetical protein
MAHASAPEKQLKRLLAGRSLRLQITKKGGITLQSRAYFSIDSCRIRAALEVASQVFAQAGV